MLTCVPNVLTKAEVAEFRGLMDSVSWEDGRSTAGAQSALVKKNEQLPPDGELSGAIHGFLPAFRFHRRRSVV